MDTCYNNHATTQTTTKSAARNFNPSLLAYAALALLAAFGVYHYTAQQPTATASAHHGLLLQPVQFPGRA